MKHKKAEISEETVNEVVEEVVNEVVEEVVNEVVEEVVNEVIEEVVNEVEPEVIEVLTGQVVNCAKLNVREDASKEAKVLCVLEKDTIVNIDPKVDQTADFYQVHTQDGVIGYCMKKFIEIK